MTKLAGNIETLNLRQREALEKIGEMTFERGEMVEWDIANILMKISLEIRREVAVFVDRAGNILRISVGENDRADVYALTKRRGIDGYCGVRCIHTHPNGTAHLSQPDLSALRSLHYDAIVAVAYKENSEELRLAIGMLVPQDGSLNHAELAIAENMSWSRYKRIPFFQELYLMERSIDRERTISTGVEKERALLVIQPERDELGEVDVIREELLELSDTAGLEVIDVIVQQKRGNQRKLGTGKLGELAMIVQNHQIDVVIFDDALTPSYNQLLSDALRAKVIDKTVLILDIFAQRARSREGKLQVELAQLNYMLPRLIGMGTALSRLGGGVGTRGPGETQLETDRRHIRRRIHHITEELAGVKKTRAVQRASRENRRGLQVALVGYTNAGKSSLLNCLVDESIYAADQLFATLDPTTRKLELDNGREILLSDTVGFIRELPPQLLDAFKATLEELQYADVLLHVVDVVKDGVDERIRVVEDIIQDLGLEKKHQVLVCNKIDLVVEVPVFTSELYYDEKCMISCKSGAGIDKLLEIIQSYDVNDQTTLDILLPYDAKQGKLLAVAHQYGKVDKESYVEDGLHLEVQLPNDVANKYFSEFIETKKSEW